MTLKQERKKYPGKNLIVFSCLLCFVLGVWVSRFFSPPQEVTYNKDFVVRDYNQLRDIMAWHGNLIAHQLVWEAIILNEEVKQIPEPLTEAYKTSRKLKIEEKIASIIREGRAELQDIGFVNKQGVNIVTILDDVSPRSTLFTPQDSFLKPRLEAVFPELLNKKANIFEIRDVAKRKSRNTQEVIWDAMWEKGWQQ